MVYTAILILPSTSTRRKHAAYLLSLNHLSRNTGAKGLIAGRGVVAIAEETPACGHRGEEGASRPQPLEEMRVEIDKKKRQQKTRNRRTKHTRGKRQEPREPAAGRKWCSVHPRRTTTGDHSK